MKKSSRISAIFEKCAQENRKAFVTYATAGYPSVSASLKFFDELVLGGADILEIGVPFSDPTADGPVIQEASQSALKNGTNLEDVLKITTELRKKHPETGIVIFSYYNIIFRYGNERFAKDFAKAGADAVLVVDLPCEEQNELAPILEKHGLHLIALVSPATPLERMKKITRSAQGFVYYITVRGVTGGRSAIPEDLQANMAKLRSVCHIPVVAGFGIASPETAKAAAGFADGIVTGSALVKMQKDESISPRGFAKSISDALMNVIK